MTACTTPISHCHGARVPWRLPYDGANTGAADRRAARVVANCAPDRPAATRIQRGRGWVAIDSTALSAFR